MGPYIPLLIFSGSLICYIIPLLAEVLLWLATNSLLSVKVVLCIANQNTSEYEKWHPSQVLMNLISAILVDILFYTLYYTYTSRTVRAR